MSETPTWTKLFTLAFNGPTFYRHEPTKRIALCTEPELPMEEGATWLDPHRPLSINITHDREWGYVPVFKPGTDEKAYAYVWVYHIFQLASGLEWPVVAHNRVFNITLMQPGAQTAEVASAPDGVVEDEEAMIAAAIAAAQAPVPPAA